MTACFACGAELVPDNGAPDEPVTYQFRNALWIALHGGYGMFVDNLEVKLPTNTEDRWLRDENGEYKTRTLPDGRLDPIENRNWEPEYREERILPGHPDYEVVICHDCAHALWEAVPWLEKLFPARNGHAHSQAYHDEHPDHDGWDYDRG